MHEFETVREAEGLATVRRGRNPLGNLACFIMRLPKAGTDVPTEMKKMLQETQPMLKFSTPEEIGALTEHAPDPALSLLVNPQTLGALAVGSLLAFPLLPAMLARLGAPRAEPVRGDLPPRLDTRSVHALPIPLLAAGFVFSVAVLVGSTLNPFLYFRF